MNKRIIGQHCSNRIQVYKLLNKISYKHIQMDFYLLKLLIDQQNRLCKQYFENNKTNGNKKISTLLNKYVNKSEKNISYIRQNYL